MDGKPQHTAIYCKAMSACSPRVGCVNVHRNVNQFGKSVSHVVTPATATFVNFSIIYPERKKGRGSC